MTAALIRHLHGAEVAEEVADYLELDVHTDPGWDPFTQAGALTR
ncbi:hypothetical protein [Lentzea alba]|nr:hypothetical protein [Lentzea alba]